MTSIPKKRTFSGTGRKDFYVKIGPWEGWDTIQPTALMKCTFKDKTIKNIKKWQLQSIKSQL
jgi:hypothetical protein